MGRSIVGVVSLFLLPRLRGKCGGFSDLSDFVPCECRMQDNCTNTLLNRATESIGTVVVFYNR
jgi:hypothetical protein